MYVYKAKIESVYDGDTITAIAELGFHIQIKLKCRLYGINAPELRGVEKKAGLISKQWLEDLILNKPVVIVTKKDKKEKYGRWLAQIYLEEDYLLENSVNQMLVDEGFAVPYMED